MKKIMIIMIAVIAVIVMMLAGCAGMTEVIQDHPAAVMAITLMPVP